jgi:ribosomal protein L16 Arg81 hydroxylase
VYLVRFERRKGLREGDVPKTLQSLIDPLPVESFLADYWEKKAVYIPANGVRNFRTLFSWHELNRLLNFGRLRYPEDIRLVQLDDLTPGSGPSDWIERCQRGATLVINRLQQLVPQLADLTAQLRTELGHRTQVNMYCSWPSYQGLNCHYDGHEVLILQVEGMKEWFVGPAMLKWPTEKGRCGDAQVTPNPYLHVTLHPGDVLYIPRGHCHHAVALDEPSIHLTVGITCRTGIDWLHWLADELTADEGWRENLPLALDGNASAMTRHVAALTERLRAVLKDGDIIAEAYADQHSSLTSSRRAEVSLPEQAGYGVSEYDKNTRFRTPKYGSSRVRQFSDQHCLILLRNKQIDVAGVSPTALRHVLERDSFTLTEVAECLPELDLEADIKPLLWRLVKEGVLISE